jgi:hypothetical protein
MGKKNDQLFEQYKHLFQYEGKNHPAFYGISCGDGWHWLLSNLLEKINAYIENKNKWAKPEEKITGFQIAQVKEKFGGLRFYSDGGDRYIDGLVSFAEEVSYNTCETCGTNQELGQTIGWISVVCKKCYDADDRTNKLKWVSNDKINEIVKPVEIVSKSAQ